MQTVTPKQSEKETIAELYNRVSKNGSQSDIDYLYELRDAEVARLGSLDEIGVTDVANLDRIGQFSIAASFFAKCSEPARQLLLNGHHFTVSAAKIALAKLNETAEKEEVEA